MSGWLQSAGLLAVLFGVIIFVIWIALRAWQKIGALRNQAITAKRAAEQARRAKEIDEDTARLTDDELNDRLRGDDH